MKTMKEVNDDDSNLIDYVVDVHEHEYTIVIQFRPIYHEINAKYYLIHSHYLPPTVTNTHNQYTS